MSRSLPTLLALVIAALVALPTGSFGEEPAAAPAVPETAPAEAAATEAPAATETPAPVATEAVPTVIAKLDRKEPVDFTREVLPILQANCLACHSATKAESELVLESPETILKGGASGAAIDLAKPTESLLLAVASGAGEPVMPPEGNTAGAKRLTSEQLGLISLWIEQGAKVGDGNRGASVAWQSLPPGVHPAYAIALSPDGTFLACGRANQVFVYYLPTGTPVTRLTDPAVAAAKIYSGPGVAHLDLVQSLAFSPDGQQLATGGYREAKIWRRPVPTQRQELAVGGEVDARSLAVSPDGAWLACLASDGQIRTWKLSDGTAGPALPAPTAPVAGMQFLATAGRLAISLGDGNVLVWDVTQAPVSEPVRIPAELAAIGLGGFGPRVVAAQTIAGAPNQVAVTSGDNVVRLVDATTGAEVRRFDQGAAVTKLAVRPDGSRLFSIGQNHAARLWNVADGAQVAQWEGDYRSEQAQTRWTAVAAVAQARLDASRVAMEAANKEVADRGTAHTQAQQARDVAVTEAQPAEATAKQAADAKTAADKLAADATAAAQTAEAERAKLAELSTLATALAEGTRATATAARTAADALASAATAANASAAAAQAALAKQPDQADLAEAKSAADQAVAQTSAAMAGAQSSLAAAEKLASARSQAATEVAAQLAAATERMAQTAAEVQKANEAKAAAEKLATDTAAAAKAAVDKRTAAEKAVADAEVASKIAIDLQAIAASKLDATTKWQSQAAQQLATTQAAAAATAIDLTAGAYSPDGLLAAVGTSVGEVRLYDGQTGAPYAVIPAHQAAITALAFAPDGRLLTAAADHTIRFWQRDADWQLAARIGPMSGDPLDVSSSTLVDRVLALGFSPDGKLLATGGGEPSRSGELKLWDTTTGALVREWADAHSDTIFGLDFSLDGRYLATSAADKFVKVFDVESGQPIRSFEGHTHHVLGVRWRHDNQVLVSCGADKAIKVWNFETGEQQRTIAGFGKEVTGICFVGNTSQTVSASGDGAVRMYNADDGANPRNFAGFGDFVHSVAVSSDARVVAAGGQDGVVRVWDAADGKVLATLELPPQADVQAAK